MADINKIARVAHEVNRAYCAAIGDATQVPWEEAPDWQRESAQAGVRAVLFGDVTEPGQSHAGWLAQKEADGWTYGKVKDVVKKTHPCMVPFEKLSTEQQTKDYLFMGVVNALK